MQAGSGLSTGRDPVRSAQEAAGQAMTRLAAERVYAALVFSTSDKTDLFNPMLRAIGDITETGNVVGCSGAGVLTEAGEIEGETGVAVLTLSSDSLKVLPFFFSDLKGRDEQIGREIGGLVSPDERARTLVVIFPDTLTCSPNHLFGGIREVAGSVPVVGGGAGSSDPSRDTTFQFHGRESTSNAVSGVILTGAIACSVGITQCCLPIGKPRLVTSSVGNSINSLDGAPALKVLIECLAGPGRDATSDLHKLASHVFVAFPSGADRELKRGQYVVRSILGVDPDNGSIYVGDDVDEGQTVCFALRDPDGARDDLKAMLEECASNSSGPGLGLYFNCAARGRGLYGISDIDTSYIRNSFTKLPVVGFFGYAEIAPLSGRTRLHNYSGVMVLVSESRTGTPTF